MGLNFCFTVMYEIYNHVRNLQSCTRSTVMYEIYNHVRNLQSCTKFAVVYEIYSRVRNLQSCTSYSRVRDLQSCTKFTVVYELQSCTRFAVMYEMGRKREHHCGMNPGRTIRRVVTLERNPAGERCSSSPVQHGPGAIVRRSPGGPCHETLADFHDAQPPTVEWPELQTGSGTVRTASA